MRQWWNSLEKVANSAVPSLSTASKAEALMQILRGDCACDSVNGLLENCARPEIVAALVDAAWLAAEAGVAEASEGPLNDLNGFVQDMERSMQSIAADATTQLLQALSLKGSATTAAHVLASNQNCLKNVAKLFRVYKASSFPVFVSYITYHIIIIHTYPDLSKRQHFDCFCEF